MFRYIAIIALFSLTATAGEWVIPWVANKDDAWASELVFNNLSSEAQTVQLTAVRTSGESQNASLQIPAYAQVTQSAGALFGELGSGSGYSVFISSESEALSSAVRVAYVGTETGFSPAMGQASNVKHSSLKLVFPTMPADGFSAPTIVNLSESPATVSLKAYTATGPTSDEVTITIPGRTPWADVITNVMPDLTDGAYLIATSDQAILGANFSFNSLVEPSMINAHASPAIGNEAIMPLLSALDATATMADAYTMGTAAVFAGKVKRACPEVTSEVNPADPENFVVASLDFGVGCNTDAGVYHAGSINLHLAREGGLTGTWLTGSLSFDQFFSHYDGSESNLDGTVALEGSAISQNFSLIADLTLSAASAVFGSSGDMTITGQMSGNLAENTFRVYGNIAVDVATIYTWIASAVVDAGDPLIYDYEACQWPSDGRIDYQVDYSGVRTDGYLDFGTGNCQTATLNMNGREETIDLSTVN